MVIIHIETARQVFAEYHIINRSGVSGKNVKQQFFGYLTAYQAGSSASSRPTMSSSRRKRFSRKALPRLRKERWAGRSFYEISLKRLDCDPRRRCLAPIHDYWRPRAHISGARLCAETVRTFRAVHMKVKSMGHHCKVGQRSAPIFFIADPR